MIPKIFPRNLTARAAVQLVGNPVTSRLESAVGNCFPGLEFDHRNLDRRFFVGLIFEFTDVGVRLLGVDLNDPDLAQGARLRKMLAGAAGNKLRNDTWFLNSISQGRTTIAISRDLGITVSWRLIHSLEPGRITIELSRRAEQAGDRVPADTVVLTGNRRTFVGSTGVISTAYAPGELSQSLCSPWMHDFRDCACFYWASNHPDIVLAEDPPGEATLPTGAPEDPVLALTPIDWLRSDRKSTAPAQATEDANRRGQIDHYEINKRWQDLGIVLRGREIDGIYQLQAPENANPLSTPDALCEKLVQLATLEHAVALEYLYAMYSLKDPATVKDQRLIEDLTFARHEILLVAVSEMRHLRWANQLIWSLEHAGLVKKNFGPSLGVEMQIPVAPDKSRPPQLPPIPGPVKTRPASLRPLEPDVLQDFISVEQPSGYLDGQYAQVLATLREKQFPATLEQLAARIIADGMEHFSRFKEVQVVLRKYPASKTYIRPITPAPADHPGGKAALDLYHQILAELQAAYATGDMEDAAHIARARSLMFQLSAQAEKLASEQHGVAFFKSQPAAPEKTGKKPARNIR
ncbi:MAG TPA: ferritin-like domain-containing protein [Terracidiphilus sp.]|nr:ferritin-like domain-containing protein [Terracidiphilus sp.]